MVRFLGYNPQVKGQNRKDFTQTAREGLWVQCASAPIYTPNPFSPATSRVRPWKVGDSEIIPKKCSYKASVSWKKHGPRLEDLGRVEERLHHCAICVGWFGAQCECQSAMQSAMQSSQKACRRGQQMSGSLSSPDWPDRAVSSLTTLPHTIRYQGP